MAAAGWREWRDNPALFQHEEMWTDFWGYARVYGPMPLALLYVRRLALWLRLVPILLTMPRAASLLWYQVKGIVGLPGG